jgi:hypothetical protein
MAVAFRAKKKGHEAMINKEEMLTILETGGATERKMNCGMNGGTVKKEISGIFFSANIQTDCLHK